MDFDTGSISALVASTLAVVLAVARITGKLLPLQALVPAWLRWVPDAVLATCASLSVTLPMCTTAIDYAAALVGAGVILILAAAQGIRGESAKD
jgi:hypothetical protein